MFSIVITERGGAQRQLELDAPEITIGRIEENDVVLPRSNVSKHHAKLVLKDDRYVLIDLKSTNGTYINGRRLGAPMLVGVGDKIYVGDFILSLQEPPRQQLIERRFRERQPTQPLSSLRPVNDAMQDPGFVTQLADPQSLPRRTTPPPPPGAGPLGGPPAVPPPIPVPPSVAPPPVPPQTAIRAVPDDRPTVESLRRLSGPPPARGSSMPPRVQSPDSAQGAATSPAVLAPSIRLQGALQTLMERLSAQMDVYEPRERAFPSDQQHLLESLIEQLATEGVLGPDLDRRFLMQAAVSETVGLGPLDRLLGNRSVREVVVEGPARILADLGGGLSPVSSFFSSPRAVQSALQRLFGRGGKLLGTGPVEEVVLPDGSHVLVLMPPLSPSGPLLCIRCPVRTPASADGLVTEGALSIDMLSTLRRAAQLRMNMLVVGPVGAGVSTMLSAIASLCQDHERIVTLEDTPSLSIRHPNALPLSVSAAAGRGVTPLLRQVARLRADRLVIDDLQAEDTLAVLTTAASSRGVLVGMHAATPKGALEQLELFAQVALGGGHASLAGLVAQAFGIVVHAGIDASGARRVHSISEIRGARDSTIELSQLFRYDGGFKAGDRPSFS